MFNCQCLLNELIIGFHKSGPLLINSAIDLKGRTIQLMSAKQLCYSKFPIKSLEKLLWKDD